MASIEKEVLTLLTSDVFSKLLTSNNLQIAQLNAAIAILIKSRIPFDVVFTPGTRRVAAAGQLTIYISPTVNLNITLAFGEGGNIFGAFP